MKELNLKKLLTDALDFHRKGRLDKADEIYLKIINIKPDDFDSNHLHGVVLSQKKNYDESIEYYDKAYSINQNNCELLNNYGISLKNTSNYIKSIKMLKKAIEYDINFTKSYLNLANCYSAQKKYDDALKTLEEGKKIDPNDTRFTKNIINIYIERYSLSKDKIHLRKAIEYLDKIDINETFDQKLISNYALVYLWDNNLEKSLKLFKIAEKKSQVLPNIDVLLNIKDKSILSHLVKHEYEQISHIDSDLDGIRNMKITQEFYNSLKKINNKRFEKYTEDDLMFISTLHKIKYNKPPKIKSSLINQDLDFQSIQNYYCSSKPQICIVDNILSKEFYDDINSFFRCANIFKRPYPRGYVGTFLGTGMANQPILQFSIDLKDKLSEIFKDYNLSQAWAFKYDSQQKGISIHADDARVNVNLWLTSDDANLDKDSGGMIIWKKKPKKSANFHDFNATVNSDKMISDVGNSEFIKVPYKGNRAVLFDSKLYHATDDITFDSNYINRRINVTFLYS